MSVTPHVPLPEHLELPAEFENVPTYLAMHDPELRIRRSAEWHEFFVLERRCRRAPAVNTGMPSVSDMHVQARDGYIHVSTVHPNYLRRPWNIVRALKEEGADLWAQGGAQKFADELDYEEKWAEETKRRRRLALYRNIAADAYGPMQRMNINGERPRISNVGTTPLHDSALVSA